MARKEVENLRNQVTRCRLELRELRAELKQRHVKIRQMQAQFWRDLQIQWHDNRMLDKTSLQQLYDNIQRALDELGPGDANYDEKEDDLDLFEYKLDKLENRFYNTEADLAGSRAGFASSSSSRSSNRSRSSTPTRPEDEASWNYRYLSRVGDANIVVERLQELSMERSQYVDHERDRAALGLDLYKPNVEFLDTFEEVYAKHESELREIDEDIERLRNESHSTPPVPARPFETTDFPLESASLTHEHDSPRSPSQRESLRRKSDGDLLKLQVDSMTVRQRVNRWILESLQASPVERARQRAMLHDPNLNDSTWRSLVVDSWQQDSMAASPPSSRRRGSKSPRSVSAQLQASSHSTRGGNKINDKDIEVDGVDYRSDVSALGWDSASKFPSKASINEHGKYDSPSTRSPYRRNDYIGRDHQDGCEIYSISASC